MNLVGNVGTLLKTADSGLVVLVGWLCVLALAVVVFLFLIAVGIRSGGQRRRPTGTQQQGAQWHQFFFGAPQSGKHRQEPRPPYERR
jgi:hypothetical protein